MSKLDEILKNKTVRILIAAVILLGILPLMWRGLEFGMDFTGGTVISVKLEKALSAQEQQTVINVMQSRLNAFGLKDISIVPFGKEFILIEIAETDPEAINQLQSLLSQQGHFETLFKGKPVLTGSDIVAVETNPQKGYGVRSGGTDYEWIAPFLIGGEAAERFANSIKGQCTVQLGSSVCAEQFYMFIDRPENAVVIMPTNMSEAEANIPDDFAVSSNKIPLQKMMDNSGVELIITDSITQDVLDKIQNKTVVIPSGTYDTQTLLTRADKVIEKEQTQTYWVQNALNIENIVHLTPGITAGNPILNPMITGHASSKDAAQAELENIVILLKSGKLPVSVNVGGVSTISPTLGSSFLQYSLLAGLGAILAVLIIIFIKYRRINILIPIMLTSLSEVTMILGIAALIKWQLDLPAVAGIIAAVGTGVDHQILITDEALRKGEDEEEVSLSAKIKKAFAVITMAASTTIFAMLPLLFIGLGMLKGFAITTIIGSLIGVIIARPAYAQVINKIL